MRFSVLFIFNGMRPSPLKMTWAAHLCAAAALNQSALA